MPFSAAQTIPLAVPLVEMLGLSRRREAIRAQGSRSGGKPGIHKRNGFQKIADCSVIKAAVEVRRLREDGASQDSG